MAALYMNDYYDNSILVFSRRQGMPVYNIAFQGTYYIVVNHLGSRDHGLNYWEEKLYRWDLARETRLNKQKMNPVPFYSAIMPDRGPSLEDMEIWM